MSDLNHPRENRLKGKFKGLLDRFMGADRSHDERPSGSRLESPNPMPTNNIMMETRSMCTRGPEVMGEATSLVCLQCAKRPMSL